MTIHHSEELRQKYREDVALHYTDGIKMEQINIKYGKDFIRECGHTILSWYEIGQELEYEQKWMQRVVELVQSEHTTIPHPTFEMLQKTGTLRVRNPDNGKVFTIYLKDWKDVVFYIGVDKGPSYQMNISEIEDWLSQLEIIHE